LLQAFGTQRGLERALQGRPELEQLGSWLEAIDAMPWCACLQPIGG
jgi:hypothetical protein